MLTRRVFANCAICAAVELVASGADAQSPAFQRFVLQQMDGPAEGYMTLLVRVEIAPNATVPRHTHPGIETGYTLEGVGELEVQDRATQKLTPGESFQVAPGVPHALQNGPVATKILSSYMVEKGKPLATPAPKQT